jgi:hypothetical protein
MSLCVSAGKFPLAILLILSSSIGESRCDFSDIQKTSIENDGTILKIPSRITIKKSWLTFDHTGDLLPLLHKSTFFSVRFQYQSQLRLANFLSLVGSSFRNPCVEFRCNFNSVSVHTQRHFQSLQIRRQLFRLVWTLIFIASRSFL